MSKQPPVVTIYNESEDLTTIRVGDGRMYDIVYDDNIGHWLVDGSVSDENKVVFEYIKTEEGAIQYTLEQLSVISSGEYTVVEAI